VQLTRFDVGGSTAFAVGPFSVYGTSGFNRPTIEGISTSGMNPFGFALDYGTFTNVSVGTGAYGPEWLTPGLHMQFITKSSGNQYAGTIYAGYEHGSWQSHNIDERQIELGAAVAEGLPASAANRLRNYRDLNGDAGGYLRKDRLWWYASARDHASSARQVNFPVQPLEAHVTTFTGKGTWRVNDTHQIVVFAQGSRNRQPIRLDGFSARLRRGTSQWSQHSGSWRRDSSGRPSGARSSARSCSSRRGPANCSLPSRIPGTAIMRGSILGSRSAPTSSP
jgi:hypothetical protein